MPIAYIRYKVATDQNLIQQPALYDVSTLNSAEQQSQIVLGIRLRLAWHRDSCGQSANVVANAVGGEVADEPQLVADECFSFGWKVCFVRRTDGSRGRIPDTPSPKRVHCQCVLVWRSGLDFLQKRTHLASFTCRLGPVRLALVAITRSLGNPEHFASASLFGNPENVSAGDNAGLGITDVGRLAGDLLCVVPP